MTDFQRREDALLEKISELVRERDEARAQLEAARVRLRILEGVQVTPVQILGRTRV